MMIEKIINKLFYNPEKMVSKSNYVECAKSTVLLKKFTIDFREKNNKVRVNIGENNMLACNLIFESSDGQIEIGHNCFINGSTQLISRKSIIIGNYVTIAWNVTIYDHDSHSLDYLNRREDISQQLFQYRSGKSIINDKNWATVNSKPIKICNDAWVGMNAIILKGVTVGEGAVIAAGSVVTKDVAPFTVVAGNPAIQVKDLKANIGNKLEK